MNKSKKLRFAAICATSVLGLVLSSSPVAAQTYTFGDYTVVEADPFANGGMAGNTTTVGGGFFSDFAFNSATWQQRLSSAPFDTGYQNVPGASDRLFENSNSAPELVTTISGLAPSTYDVSVVYLYRQDSDTAAGLLANLYGSTNPAYSRQLYDRSEVEATIGTPGGSTWAVGLASLGTTAASSTSFTVNIDEFDTIGGAAGIYTNGGYFGVAYKAVPDLPSLPTPTGFINAADVIYGGPFNAADSTEKLRAALATGLDVFVPNMGAEMDWITEGLFLTNDNQTIRFEEGVVIEAKAGAFGNANNSLFEAEAVTGVRLEGYGATLSMGNIDSAALGGDWRHAIDLTSVTNFEIAGLTINNAAGDGIYVGSTFGMNSEFSDTVTIEDVVIDGAYRNGISVISAQDLTIDNAVIINTDGTPPQTGIDFEPNSPDQRIVNAIVRNSTIVGNTGDGIDMAVSDAAQTLPVSILIENNTIAGNADDGVTFGKDAIAGVVLLDNIVVNNGGIGLRNVTGVGTVTMTNSAFSGNGADISSGATIPGAVTNVPIFVDNTDPTNPLYYYLDPSTSTLISLGASDGSFMGARGVAGDFDADAGIDGFDFLSWQQGESPNQGSAGDLAAWETYFGAVGAPLSGLAAGVDAVPEPSTSLLMLGGLVCGSLLGRKRKFGLA